MMSVLGFMVAVRDTMRLKRGGLLFGGVPCSGSLGRTVLA